MSYQQSRPVSGIHKLNEFVPTYVPHSEYLPTNRVLDANQPEAQKWVLYALFSWLITSNKKGLGTSTRNVQLNSIHPAMFQCALLKTWLSTSPYPRLSSKAESKECDQNPIIIPFTCNLLCLVCLLT